MGKFFRQSLRTFHCLSDFGLQKSKKMKPRVAPWACLGQTVEQPQELSDKICPREVLRDLPWAKSLLTLRDHGVVVFFMKSRLQNLLGACLFPNIFNCG